MLYKNKFSFGAAVANQSGAMEADTIFKNGRSSKSLMSRVNSLRKLLLLALFLPHVVLAQSVYISPDIKPHVEFIEKCNTSPVDYIMGLFEQYDVVVLGERDHRDTTQYILIQQILSDPRFIDKVGNVLTEVGVYNMRDELNSVLQTDYQNSSALDKALASVNFYLQWIPLWDKTNYIQLQKDIYYINKKVPTHKKINMYPTDVQFSWKLNDIGTAAKYRPFFKILDYRDLIMGNNAIDALYKIFSEERKKALIIYNTPHSCKFVYEDTGSPHHFAYQVIEDHFPGRVANVALNCAVLERYNGLYTGLSNNGKWDAAFAACDNKSVGFDLSGTIFGDDTFDLFSAKTDKSFKDVYHGFIFYKPVSEWISGGACPIFSNLDKSYVREELARRFMIFQGQSELTEEFKDELYNSVIKNNSYKIFSGEILQTINNQIERYYKPN